MKIIIVMFMLFLAYTQSVTGVDQGTYQESTND